MSTSVPFVLYVLIGLGGVLLAALWLSVPLVLLRLLSRARKQNELLAEQTEWLKNICKLLDPDGTRYAAHLAHQAARARNTS